MSIKSQETTKGLSIEASKVGIFQVINYEEPKNM